MEKYHTAIAPASDSARRGADHVRIALLTRRFDPAGGGTERDLIATADGLRLAGHRVVIYAAEARGSWTGGAVREVAVPRLSRALAIVRFAYLAPAIARREGADLVLSFARVVGADILRSGGGAHLSYVRAARQWRSIAGAASMWTSPYHRAQMVIERRGFAHPGLRRVVAVSNLVRDDLVRQFGLGAGIAVTLYNGVDIERFTPARDTVDSRRIRLELAIGGSAPVVIFVGNGFARKGLGSMLQAWRGLKANPYLIVAGNDRSLAGYQRIARRLGIDERVRFLGAQNRVEDLFHAADVMALPSLFEPFGNAVMEAMASGLPALTSSRCGVAELMPPELREFVVNDPSDPSEIAARLDALVKARNEVAKSARPIAEKFTWKRYTEELLGILASVERKPG